MNTSSARRKGQSINQSQQLEIQSFVRSVSCVHSFSPLSLSFPLADNYHSRSATLWRRLGPIYYKKLSLPLYFTHQVQLLLVAVVIYTTSLNSLRDYSM